MRQSYLPYNYYSISNRLNFRTFIPLDEVLDYLYSSGKAYHGGFLLLTHEYGSRTQRLLKPTTGQDPKPVKSICHLYILVHTIYPNITFPSVATSKTFRHKILYAFIHYS